jgi:hypothetical protein
MRPGLAVLLLLSLAATGIAGDLPFLPRDGAIWADGDASFPWIPGPVPIEDEEDAPGSPSRLRPEVLGPRDAILDQAIRAAYGRRVRIELSIALAGKTLDLTGVVPEGAVLHEDARDGRSWPAALDLEGKCGMPKPALFNLGTAVDASASRRIGGDWTLRLAIRTSRVVAEHRFEGDCPTLVAPELEFASLVVAVPVRPSEKGRFRADGPTGDGTLTVDYRIVVVDDPALPPGTRVYPLHALAPLVALAPPPAPGLLSAAADESDVEEPDIFEEWAAAAGEGLRLVDVWPGVVIAVGEETALAGFDRVVEAWWRARGPDVTLVRSRGEKERTRTEIPLAGGARALLVQGRVRPVAIDVQTAVVQEIATAGVAPAWLFTGRRLVVTAGASGVVRVEEMIGRVGKIVREVQEIAIRDVDGARRLRLPRDRFSVKVTRAAASYGPGETREETGKGRPIVTVVHPGRGPR